MKTKEHCFKILTVVFFGLMFILAGGVQPLLGQTPPAAAPTLDGWLDAVYLTHGKSYSYSGFYKQANATLHIIDYNGTGNPDLDDYVYIAWVIDRAFNDNSYEANRHVTWTGGHQFFDLYESDKQRLDLENDCGEVVLDVTMDLLYGTGTEPTPSGYQAIWNLADEDSEQLYVNHPSVSPPFPSTTLWPTTVFDYSTSLDANLNLSGFCESQSCIEPPITTCPIPTTCTTDLHIDSPPFANPTDPNDYTVVSPYNYNDYWEVSLIWELKIDRTVFNKTCVNCVCDGVYQGVATNPVELHASPSKIGVSPVTSFSDPGMIGDYVWHDINRDGVQDIGEPGFANVIVDLYTDPDCDDNTDDGFSVRTTTTDSNGYYAFLDVGTGCYKVKVHDDNFLSDGVLYNFSPTTGTSNPHGVIPLQLGDYTLPDYLPEYRDADFGFANDNTKAVIGDYVWFDVNNDGIQDPDEQGIGGVTLRLIADLNDDLVWDPATETIDTKTTADDGSYLFTNLAPEDYKVEVTDTGGVLTGYTLTTGPQSSVNPTRVIRVAAGDVYLNADFGYDNDGINLYSIGNQVWLEYDKAGRYPSALPDYYEQDVGHGVYGTTSSSEEGIGNVTINLLKDVGTIGEKDAGDWIIATTTTDANGNYSFDNLVPGDYLVEVSDVNNVLKDYRKSLFYNDLAVDPTASDDPLYNNYSKREAFAVTITNANNTTADFGYWADVSSGSPGIVGDYVWHDMDGDTVQDPGEPGIEGVHVELYKMVKQGQSWNEEFVAQTLTDANGHYLFTNLDVGNASNKAIIYRVRVLASNWDTGNALEGYNTTPTNPQDPATPPTDPNPNGRNSTGLYTGGPTEDLSLDFGYQFPIGTGTYNIGDLVWLDINEDGLSTGESGIEGVTLDLYWDANNNDTFDAGDQFMATDTTDASGVYGFTGLVDGETYFVQITDENNRLIGLKQTFSYGAGSPPTPPFYTTVTVTINSADDLDVDFGFNINNPPETPVLLSSFRVYSQSGQVVVHWETASETGTAGFYLLRHSPTNPRSQQVNKKLLTGLLHSPQGGVYRYVDTDAFPGETYTYRLVEVEFSGEKRFYGPFNVTVEPSPPGMELKPIQGIYSKKPHQLLSPGKTDRLLARQTDLQTARVLKKSRQGNEVKIVVKEKGIYYLDAASIANMLGMSPKQVEQKINNHQFIMTNWGHEIAYLPAGTGTGIYFYGQDMDSLYTDENLYWLEKRKGTVMETVNGGQPAPGSENDTFMDTLHIEEDHYAATALFNDPEVDYWMWDYIMAGSASKSFTFNAPGAAAAGPAALTVYLQGGTDTTADPDHHVKVALNGTFIGEGQWNGKDPHRFTVTIDQSLIIDGTNTIELTGHLSGGAPYSLFYVDGFELDYNRHYRALDNRMICRGGENPVVTIVGFTDSNIRVFDVTDPQRPKRVTGTFIDFTGNHRVSFMPSSPDSIYAAVSGTGAQAPFSAFANKASGLKKHENKADYVVIVPEGLEDIALGLTDLRQGKGMDAMVVELEDIYDEFNFGSPSPAAIKDFLTYAYYNWNKNGPQYVVLAGEGTYDYKNIMGYGDNLVPSMLMKTNRSLFASDNWFADVAGNDGVPEIAIGRLPVMNAAELQDYIDKISQYESSGGQWTNRVLMLADNPDQAGNFPADSSYLSNLFPGYTVELIHLPDFATAEQARQKVLEGFNNGAALINYIGHAGLDRLAQEKLLWTGDVPAMQNQDRLPLMTAMTCTVGRFGIPGYDSLGEKLVLKTDGGVAAMWAPTGLSVNSLARQLAENFFKAAFMAQEKTVGKAVLKTLADYKALDGPPFMLHIYTLLGDPALEIK